MWQSARWVMAQKLVKLYLLDVGGANFSHHDHGWHLSSFVEQGRIFSDDHDISTRLRKIAASLGRLCNRTAESQFEATGMQQFH